MAGGRRPGRLHAIAPMSMRTRASEATFALHQVGYVARVLAHRAPQPARFAYAIGARARSSTSGPGEGFHLTLTTAQLATFSVERLDGEIGLSSSWQEPVKASAFEKDPDVKIQRTVKPAGTVDGGDLVVVDLRVTFGPKAAQGCHRVTELVPSGPRPGQRPRAASSTPEIGRVPDGYRLPGGADRSARRLLRRFRWDAHDRAPALRRAGHHRRHLRVGADNRRVAQQRGPGGHRPCR